MNGRGPDAMLINKEGPAMRTKKLKKKKKSINLN